MWGRSILQLLPNSQLSIIRITTADPTSPRLCLINLNQLTEDEADIIDNIERTSLYINDDEFIRAFVVSPA